MPQTLSHIDREFYRYCCLDSAVTYEINEVLEKRVLGTAKTQYKFNIEMLLPLRYMELRGIRYDSNLAQERRNLLLTKMHELQAKFNTLTGHGFSWNSTKAVVQRAEEVMLTKDKSRPRKSHIENWERFNTLLKTTSPSLALVGEIEDLCKVSLNEGSKVNFQHYLYMVLKLPIQLSEKDKTTGKQHPTTDYGALLNLSKHCKQNNLTHEHEIIQLAITLRALGTRTTNLGCNFDRDGRMRFAPNIVGSNTGRIQYSLSSTGRGRAGQGIPKYSTEDEAPGGVLGDRDLFPADEGYYSFECDLEGADSWTVAAYSAMLGDSTMLRHLQAGVRPAKVLTLKLRGVELDYHDIEALIDASKKVEKSSWEYFACKRVVHGGTYLEGEIKVSGNIIKDSEGKMFLPSSECKKLLNLLKFDLYKGIPKYHQHIGRLLVQQNMKLTTASGQNRQFFGRPDEVMTKAVAFEPQANTTHVLKLALWKLVSDPTNWWKTNDQPNLSFEERWLVYNDEMHIQPQLTIHDALLGQFRIANTKWAVPKIRSYFSNEVTIAGIKLTIPYEGGYGPSWGNLKSGVIK